MSTLYVISVDGSTPHWLEQWVPQSCVVTSSRRPLPPVPVDTSVTFEPGYAACTAFSSAACIAPPGMVVSLVTALVSTSTSTCACHAALWPGASGGGGEGGGGEGGGGSGGGEEGGGEGVDGDEGGSEGGGGEKGSGGGGGLGGEGGEGGGSSVGGRGEGGGASGDGESLIIPVQGGRGFGGGGGRGIPVAG